MVAPMATVSKTALTLAGSRNEVSIVGSVSPGLDKLLLLFCWCVTAGSVSSTINSMSHPGTIRWPCGVPHARLPVRCSVILCHMNAF